VYSNQNYTYYKNFTKFLTIGFSPFYNGQFFPTVEESIEYYNQKGCVDGKGIYSTKSDCEWPSLL
jgi:hypothetical protein